MSTHNKAQPITRIGDVDDLAEVIELHGVNAPSFYQRNSGSLPKANTGITDAHRRSDLPRPENSDKDSFGDIVRKVFKR